MKDKLQIMKKLPEYKYLGDYTKNDINVGDKVSFFVMFTSSGGLVLARDYIVREVGEERFIIQITENNSQPILFKNVFSINK